MSDPRPALRKKFVVWTLATAGLALLLGRAILPGIEVPQVHWRFGEERREVAAFDEVHRYEDMELALVLPKPAWVYVASFDFTRGGVGYFPTEYLNSAYTKTGWSKAHHLPAGRHVLPGPDFDDKPQTWYVPGADQTLALCVVVSEQRLAGLDQVMQKMRQFGNTAFPSGGFGFYMPREGKAALQGRKAFPHPLLEEARHGARPGPLAWQSQERKGVSLHCFHLRAKPARPGVKNPDPMHKRITEMLSKQRKGEALPLPMPAKPGK